MSDHKDITDPKFLEESLQKYLQPRHYDCEACQLIHDEIRTHGIDYSLQRRLSDPHLMKVLGNLVRDKARTYATIQALIDQSIKRSNEDVERARQQVKIIDTDHTISEE